MDTIKSVLVTGGAGYVGSALIPKLLDKGYRVKVLDLFFFGVEALDQVKGHERLELINGDIRDQGLLQNILPGCEAVIHLACISNDPSFELNPELGRAINYDAFGPLVDISKESGVSRFIYASSSSVYGIKSELNVTEELSLQPLTDYSKYKAMCEDVLLEKKTTGFSTLIIRPATVCGYAPRLRLDLTVNILTNHAVNKRKIKVFGGEQLRPNIHVEDMSDLYVRTLELPSSLIDGKVYNAGYENHSIKEIAEMVQSRVGDDVLTETTPTDDLRSYHISSAKIKEELGFCPRYSIGDAIESLLKAFNQGRVPKAFEDKKYYNIKTMQELNL
ncbi:MAG: nucleoside-diphosphate-sugar epimerase [Chlamydiales bacterium]|jgi:nucleoside-diphosphate-sugar epimerase